MADVTIIASFPGSHRELEYVRGNPEAVAELDAGDVPPTFNPVPDLVVPADAKDRVLIVITKIPVVIVQTFETQDPDEPTPTPIPVSDGTDPITCYTSLLQTGRTSVYVRTP